MTVEVLGDALDVHIDPVRGKPVWIRVERRDRRKRADEEEHRDRGRRGRESEGRDPAPAAAEVREPYERNHHEKVLASQDRGHERDREDHVPLLDRGDEQNHQQKKAESIRQHRVIEVPAEAHRQREPPPNGEERRQSCHRISREEAHEERDRGPD